MGVPIAEVTVRTGDWLGVIVVVRTITVPEVVIVWVIVSQGIVLWDGGWLGLIVLVTTTSLPEIVVVLVTISLGVVGGVETTISAEDTSGGLVLWLGVISAGGITP